MPVFHAIETAQRHPPRIRICWIKPEDLTLNPRDHLCTLIRIRLTLLCRRHQIGPEILPDPQPQLLIIQFVNAIDGIIEGNLSLRGPITMTIVAILFEERLNPPLKFTSCDTFSFRCLDRRGGEATHHQSQARKGGPEFFKARDQG